VVPTPPGVPVTMTPGTSSVNVVRIRSVPDVEDQVIEPRLLHHRPIEACRQRAVAIPDFIRRDEP
jgi:hypothetical protein